MITTTLRHLSSNAISYPEEWKKLIDGLGKDKADDERIPFHEIVEICGLGYAIRCGQAEPQYAKEWRLFAVWCARQAQHLMPEQQIISALDVAGAFANGLATADELRSAQIAADSTEWVRSPARVWLAARKAARDTLHDASWDAARDAAHDSALAISISTALSAARKMAMETPPSEYGAAHNARWDAIYNASLSDSLIAIESAQKKEFLRIVG